VNRLLLVTSIALLACVGLASAFTPRERDAPWQLAGVSADGRTLHLMYEGGGCLEADGRPVVTETDAAVTIVVHQTQQVPGEGEACTLEIRNLRVDAQLAAPVAGRRVLGGPPFASFVKPTRMPRVTGLRRYDAARLIERCGLTVKLRGPRGGTVVRQRPRAGAAMPDFAVTLHTTSR
jgi:hypothetical protein